MEEKVTIIPQELLAAIRTELNLSQQQASNKTNKLLSETTISLFVLKKSIAENLKIDEGRLEACRVQAVEAL